MLLSKVRSFNKISILIPFSLANITVHLYSANENRTEKIIVN